MNKTVWENFIQRSQEGKRFRIIKNRNNNMMWIQCKEDIRFVELNFGPELNYFWNGRKLYNESLIKTGE
jgi:hypothetical protein